ncbi:MAG: hypothetical protein ACRDQX_16625, partial [Pseudonocardiaceae bacterium]
GGTVVLDPARLRRENDAEVVARLTTVRGIGKWSAEMFLMFDSNALTSYNGSTDCEKSGRSQEAGRGEHHPREEPSQALHCALHGRRQAV